jgi:hypothetical protein
MEFGFDERRKCPLVRGAYEVDRLRKKVSVAS